MTKGAIVAIGGGQIFVPCQPAETTAIDKVTVEIAKEIQGLNQVRVLFIPTASGDDIYYCNTVYNQFHLRLGCEYEHLRLVEEKPTREEIAEKINRAHIIYVGGGNTREMMKVWKEVGVDVLLRQAYDNGAVMTGLSAGSICWFTAGLSDSEKLDGKVDWKPVWVEGLGIIKALHSPHYNSEPWRKDAVAEKVAGTQLEVIVVDDNCALVVKNGMYKIISSRKESGARHISKYSSLPISETTYWKPLSQIIV